MVFQSDMGPTVRLVLAEARRAAELDPLDARAHTAIGYALGIAGDSSKPRSNVMKHCVSTRIRLMSCYLILAGLLLLEKARQEQRR